jgi:CBS domain-containing protein
VERSRPYPYETAPGFTLGLTGAPFFERDPMVVHPATSVGEAVAALLDRGLPGAPIVDDRGTYTGACTLRHLVARGLIVDATGAASGVQSLAYFNEDLSRMRRRFIDRADAPISSALDPSVPIVDTTCSLPQALLLLHRNAPFLAVLEGSDGSLAGIVTLQGALRALAVAAASPGAERA